MFSWLFLEYILCGCCHKPIDLLEEAVECSSDSTMIGVVLQVKPNFISKAQYDNVQVCEIISTNEPTLEDGRVLHENRWPFHENLSFKKSYKYEHDSESS